jgi:hypothetical protein
MRHCRLVFHGGGDEKDGRGESGGSTLVVFIPFGVRRAKAEEGALARRFGAEWADEAAKTCFILPSVK